MRAALIAVFIGGALSACYRAVGEPDSGAPPDGGGSDAGTPSDGGDADAGTPLDAGDANPSCGFHLVWKGDHCVAVDCAVAPETVPCALDDGGFGACLDERCQAGIDPYSSDPNNCGWFGLTCPDGTHCSGGSCVDARDNLVGCDAGSCAVGEFCVGRDNSLGAYCIVAVCNPDWVGRPCLSSVPQRDGTCCGASCVTLDSNDYCGGCGVACPAGTFCELSAIPANCRPLVDCSDAGAGAECPLPDGSAGLCCHGVCTDVGRDPTNCGGCGLGCVEGSDCVFGFYEPGFPEVASCKPTLGTDAGSLVCDCPPGRSCLNDFWLNDFRCVTSACTTATEGDACGTYSELLGSPPNQGVRSGISICCSSSCSELDRDPFNCGRCGEACPPGTFCEQGGCVGAIDCGSQANNQPCALGTGQTGICCDGACVDSRSDPKHCSSCALACPTGASCQKANPVYGDESRCMAADGGSADCLAQGCDPGWGCSQSSGGCLPLGCGKNYEECAYGSGGDAGYQSGWCCGSICGANWECGLEASCRGRPDGEFCDGDGGAWRGECCGQACVDLTRDPNNCGGCGIACDICTQGGCLPEGPAGDCKATCGFGTICVAGGVCVDSTCWGYQGSFGFCLAQDGNVGTCCWPDRSCADVRNDPQNCGACGIACTAGQSCVRGACQ